MKDKFGIKGHMHLELRGPDGKLKEVRDHHNTVTELGDAHVADAMSDKGEGALGFMGVGTGSGQTSASTGLATLLDRNALTSTTQGTGDNDNDVVFVASWGAGEGMGNLTEVGIFLSDNNTSMNYYASFAALPKGALDTLQISWTVSYGAS